VTLSGFGTDSSGESLDQTYVFDFHCEGTYHYIGEREQILKYTPTLGEEAWELIDKNGQSYKRSRPPHKFNKQGFKAQYQDGAGWGQGHNGAPLPLETTTTEAVLEEATALTEGVVFLRGKFLPASP
jgi:hypothetical protein